MITYSPNDINRTLAYDAHQGTSFTPEKRADDIITTYTNEMQSLIDEFTPWLTEYNQAEMSADLEHYRKGYIDKLHAYLGAHSRVMSTMITGPSNFPTRRNEKRSDTADKRRGEFLEYQTRIKELLRKKYDPRRIAARPISADDSDAITQLQIKIEKAEQRQTLMKSVNAITRCKIADSEKVAKLIELGITEATALKMIDPASDWDGFPAYELTNNNANIRRMKERIEQLEKERARPETNDIEIDGGITISENTSINRLQIFFPDKPSSEVRDTLKSHGFKWSPREGAWQRQLNDNARITVKRIFNL